MESLLFLSSLLSLSFSLNELKTILMKLLSPVSLEDIPLLQTRVVLKLRGGEMYSPFCSVAAISSPSGTTRSVGYSCGRDGGACPR